ncbi:MAG: L,D-transpeptidase family protein [Anaerolineales bacterium]
MTASIQMGKLRKTPSRRDFLKLTAASAAGMLWLPPREDRGGARLSSGERFGRAVEPRVEIKARPRADSQTVSVLSQDEVVIWLRDIVGVYPGRSNPVWAETPDGYVHASFLQPVQDLKNDPETRLPDSSLGAGMWAEITVPWVEFILDNPPARSPWLHNTENPRLYYSQIFWVDQIRQDEQGLSWYRLNERYAFGDRLWAPAEAFRRITPEEIAPIRPERDDKRVIVRLRDQSLSCFEGSTEVYFTRVSNGVNFDPLGNPIDRSSTPAGPHPIWRKMISTHMVGGTTGGGWDLPGIGWTTLFVGNGVAVHSTYWHNDFGTPRSRGCVNNRPEDAKWVFRWVDPVVPYDPGDVTVSMPGGTIVEVVDA